MNLVWIDARVDPAHILQQTFQATDRFNTSECETLPKKLTQLSLGLTAVVVGVTAVAREIMIALAAIFLVPATIALCVFRVVTFSQACEETYQCLPGMQACGYQAKRIGAQILGVGSSLFVGAGLFWLNGAEWNISLQTQLGNYTRPKIEPKDDVVQPPNAPQDVPTENAPTSPTTTSAPPLRALPKPPALKGSSPPLKGAMSPLPPPRAAANAAPSVAESESVPVAPPAPPPRGTPSDAPPAKPPAVPPPPPPPPPKEPTPKAPAQAESSTKSQELFSPRDDDLRKWLSMGKKQLRVRLSPEEQAKQNKKEAKEKLKNELKAKTQRSGVKHAFLICLQGNKLETDDPDEVPRDYIEPQRDVNKGGYTVDAYMDLWEVDGLLGFEIPNEDDDVKTIRQYIAKNHPDKKVGDKILLKTLEIEILGMDAKGVNKVFLKHIID